MTQIESNIDAFVRRLKNDSAVSAYRFVKGFSADNADNPLCEPIIAVSIKEVEISDAFIGNYVESGVSGRQYKTQVQFRIYSPREGIESSLTQAALSLCEAIKRCDVSGFVEQVKSGCVSFDSNTDTVFRDVSAVFSFCLCEEVTQ